MTGVAVSQGVEGSLGRGALIKAFFENCFHGALARAVVSQSALVGDFQTWAAILFLEPDKALGGV